MREEGGCQEGVTCFASDPMFTVAQPQVMALLICRGMYCWNPLKARFFAAFACLSQEESDF